MIEDICFHCQRVTNCVESGRFMLCDDHKALKQYQAKEKKVTRIKPRSNKRAKQEVEYLKVRKEYLATQENCEVCINEGQHVNTASQIHHKSGRIGDLLTNKRLFLAVCQDCHQQVESDPLWSKLNGYSIDRL